ncbi:MAG: TonB-dependent siderophore receptor [Gammaproteobacteria bacterium]
MTTTLKNVRILVPAVLLLGPTAGLAQDPATAQGEVETVEIAAQRQPFRGDTPIEELPQSVQILSAELLQDIAVSQLDDALDLASGVARQNTFGGLWDSFAIRGFAGDENTPSGYLVNGFNAGRGFSGRRDASNIERIEIVKGPGSALYGRAEPGGTINIVTKKPQFERAGSLELAAARFDTYRLAADFTGPITDSIAFRLNGAYDDADSFREFVTSERLSVTPSFLVQFSNTTTLSYEFEYVRQEAPFERGIVAPFGELGAVPVERFLGEPADGNTEINAKGHQLVLQHELAQHWTLHTGFGYRESSFTGFSSDPELVASRQSFYTDGRTLSRQRRFRDYDSTDLTARAEISGRVEGGPLTHHVLFGVDYYDYELETLQNRFRPTLANPYAIDVFNPVYGQTRTLGPFQNQIENQDATGIYLQDQIDITERLKVLAGVRYDDFSQQIDNRITSTTQTADDSETSPRAGIVFDATDSVSLYAAWSKGFRPNTGVNAAGIAFAPELSESYEVGTKFASSGGRFSGTVAIYRAEKSNMLTADPINAGFSIAAGEAQSQGLEIDASGQLTDNLRFTFAYAYTDAEVTEAALDPNFGFVLPAGSRLINIPEHSANVLLMQSFQIAGRELTAGIGANYVGERLGETGVPTFELPDYTLVRMTGSFAATESLRFFVDVENVFDETYYPSSYARIWVAPGAPRTYAVRALWQFGAE